MADANEQKFFGSFLQKRTAFFTGRYQGNVDLTFGKCINDVCNRFLFRDHIGMTHSRDDRHGNVVTQLIEDFGEFGWEKQFVLSADEDLRFRMRFIVEPPTVPMRCMAGMLQKKAVLF